MSKTDKVGSIREIFIQISSNKKEKIVNIDRIIDNKLNKIYDVYHIKTNKDEYILKKYKKEYEAKIYETFFVNRGLSVPKYMGKTMDSKGNLWFLIEYIQGNDFEDKSLNDYTKLALELVRIHSKFMDIDGNDYGFMRDSHKIRSEKILKLKDLVDNNSINWDKGIINTLEYGLKRFHDGPKTLIHDDLLPINIIGKEDNIKIIDWGFASIGCYSHDIGRLLGDYKNDKGDLWVNKLWHKEILSVYYNGLCSSCREDISWEDFIIDYHCSKLWNYGDIVLSHIFNDWEVTDWYRLNFENMINIVHIIKDKLT
ncbi:aminoglycoside phosphotransferase family protein [Dethiothermospora halolimnae]|uniref:aminoglycoside phosphotransferase family protein n=1 Tax=Dethiothermospora halolimnae TaxID=3114390 RepID=UPI003CCBBE84